MLYVFLLAIIVVFLVAEKCIHRARLERIPIRIHVNGTRGKSTVTRLTAELLRRAGIPTLAKTTGDHPVLILPDGRSAPLPRRGPARIQEQMRIVARAAREQARAVVLECMALDPVLQQVSEEAMVRATVGVITNSRPDHLEVMGGSPESVADALSRSIPAAAVLVTPLGPGTNRFREVATRRHTTVRAADSQALPPGIGGGDPILVEHLALVRSIGVAAGISAERVDEILAGIAAQEHTPAVRHRGRGDRRLALVDAFSINDPVSTATFQRWALAGKGEELPRPWVALLNTRADRPLRTRQFCRLIAAEPAYDAVGLAGPGRLLARWYLRGRAAGRPVLLLPDTDPAGMLQSLSRRTGSQGFTLIGLGNHRGAGERFRRHFEEAA